MVWAVPVSLAATQGIARTFFPNVMALTHQVWELLPKPMLKHPFRKKVPLLLSIPTGTEMFHFPAYAPSYKGSY